MLARKIQLEAYLAVEHQLPAVGAPAPAELIRNAPCEPLGRRKLPILAARDWQAVMPQPHHIQIKQTQWHAEVAV